MTTQFANNDGLLGQHCPFCQADLEEVGVNGVQALDFRAFPFVPAPEEPVERLPFDDTWEVHNWDFFGAIIYCGECGKTLGRTGIFETEALDV